MKKDVYQLITDRIVEAMDNGIVPWRVTWVRSGPPHNGQTGRQYSGINALLLPMYAAAAGYETSAWWTYKQAAAHGGNVKKGEKGFPVVFYKIIERQNKKTGQIEKMPILRYFTVFNASQCEGVPVEPAPEEVTYDNTTDERSETIVQNYLSNNGPALMFEGEQPCYIPALDTVKTPAIGKFEDSTEYYHTLFHELVHSTGHESRLNRLKSKSYAHEELVAEIGASFLANHAGLPFFEDAEKLGRSAAYLKGWRDRIAQDPRLIFEASAKAKKAAEHIAPEMAAAYAYEAPEAAEVEAQ